jgi:hypothetical protein
LVVSVEVFDDSIFCCRIFGRLDCHCGSVDGVWRVICGRLSAVERLRMLYCCSWHRRLAVKLVDRARTGSR